MQKQQAAFCDFEQASARLYPERLPEIQYPKGFLCRRISSAGELTWKHQDAYCTRVLAGEVVGLSEVEDSLYEIYFGSQLLGWFDSREIVFVADRAPRWHSPVAPAPPTELSCDRG